MGRITLGKEPPKTKERIIIDPPVDPNLHYRESEIVPEVLSQLQEARKRGGYPCRAFIDAVISWQNEKSPEMACRYIGYKYLGTFTYVECYGPKVEHKLHHEQQDQMMEIIKSQGESIENLQNQLNQMQRLIVNMAKTINESHMIRLAG